MSRAGHCLRSTATIDESHQLLSKVVGSTITLGISECRIDFYRPQVRTEGVVMEDKAQVLRLGREAKAG